MPSRPNRIDLASYVVMIITFVLFVIGAVEKGLTQELLLEAGVFLVSVKLILMSAKSNVTAQQIANRLDAIQASLERFEQSRPREV